jgi:hypothetical protein
VAYFTPGFSISSFWGSIIWFNCTFFGFQFL